VPEAAVGVLEGGECGEYLIRCAAAEVVGVERVFERAHLITGEEGGDLLLGLSG
jgi:hypothetical protein